MTSADLENLLDRYLELRRTLGFEMRVEGRLLHDFLTFLQERTLAEPLIAQAAVDWASSRGGPNSQSKRLSMARCFLVHLRAHLPGIQVPMPGLIPCGVRPTPYIYSEAQIAMLMKEASALKPTGSLRPHTYATLIGLLASCGLRPGEAVRLCDADVELETIPPRLAIRETKFHKSRLVPVDSTTAEALRSYASTRNVWVMTVFLKLSSFPSPALLWPTARWALRSWTLSVVWASTEWTVHTALTCGAFATLLPFGAWSIGTAKAWMSINSCRIYPSIWGMQSPRIPTGI